MACTGGGGGGGGGEGDQTSLVHMQVIAFHGYMRTKIQSYATKI